MYHVIEDYWFEVDCNGNYSLMLDLHRKKQLKNKETGLMEETDEDDFKDLSVHCTSLESALTCFIRVLNAVKLKGKDRKELSDALKVVHENNLLLTDLIHKFAAELKVEDIRREEKMRLVRQGCKNDFNIKLNNQS